MTTTTAPQGRTATAPPGRTDTAPQGRTELLRPDRTPVRVLVVDDEAPLAELLSMALRYEGWEVRSAGDGPGPCARPGTSARTRWSWT